MTKFTTKKKKIKKKYPIRSKKKKREKEIKSSLITDNNHIALENLAEKLFKLTGSQEGNSVPKKNTQTLITFLLLLLLSLSRSAVCVGLLAHPWTVAHQAPLSMKFPRQEY